MWFGLVVLPAQGVGMNTALLVLLFVVWLAAVIFLRRARIWLPYYVLGAVGFAYWLILVISNLLGIEPFLAHSVAWMVHVTSNLLGIPTRIFEGAPGVLLVLVIYQDIGWTVLQVGIESSGLLEISVLMSLLLFYPGWSLPRRLWLIAIGGIAMWTANILRMLVIVVMLNQFGKEALVLAHMYVGKAVFFVLVILIFWFIITRPTLKDLHRRQSQLRPMIG
jgi:exosortase family protein XrtG